jgi:hypothetical protein
MRAPVDQEDRHRRSIDFANHFQRQYQRSRDRAIGNGPALTTTCASSIARPCDTQIGSELDAVLEEAAAIPVPLAQAVQDEAQRAAVVALLDHATTLTGLFRNQLPAAMEVTVGFDENDRD